MKQQTGRKSIVIFGYGNIGKHLSKVLANSRITQQYIVNQSTIFNEKNKKVGEKRNWEKIVKNTDVAFIAIPSKNEGKEALTYTLYFLKKGKPVITCEKSTTAFHWDTLKKYNKLYRYTASVGGGTAMLKKISKYSPQDIKGIKAVINGTLNYIGEALAHTKDTQSIMEEVQKKGYTEPGANSFETIIESELRDVVLKTVIIANHSGIFKKTIKVNDITITPPTDTIIRTKRCAVYITKNNICAGFIEDTESNWLPKGVNNVLYINGRLKTVGPGAGAKPTVTTMLEDYRTLMV